MSPIGKPRVLGMTVCFCLLFLIPLQSRAADLLAFPQPPGDSAPPLLMETKTSLAQDSEAACDLGFNLSTAYGQRLLPWLRGEVESGWMKMPQSSQYSAQQYTALDDQDLNQSQCGMLNLLADFTTKSELRPFVGLGMGLTKSAWESEYLGPSADSRLARTSSDIALAYQAMLGVMWNAAPHWGLELRGRYLDGSQLGYHSSAAGAADSLDADSSSFWVVDLGLSFNF